jgi:uncharacterized phage protein (TIGR02218 family)
MGMFSRYSEFIDFARGPQHWRYTSDDRPVIFGSQTYDPVPFKRGSISESFDAARGVLDIDVPLTLPLLDMYRGTSPMADIKVILYRRQKSTGKVSIRWIGVIGSVEFKTSIATVHGLPPGSRLSSNGLNQCWAKQCDRLVYGAGLGECNKDPNAMRVDAVLSDVQGSTARSDVFASKPSNWFAGGWFEWTDGTSIERRFIVEHVGDTVTFLTPALAANGTAGATYPGCDHTLDTCDKKFNNSINYGGDPWIPEKDPFGSDPIFS